MFKKKSVSTTSTAKIKVYRDQAGEYRWRLVGRNGKIMADSAEGYVTKHNCNQAIARFMAAAPNAPIVEAAEDLSL